jgi:hypothetical protein
MAYSLDNITRVNLADDGTVNAVQGDGSFANDGSNGKVMVRIPKFYVYATKDGSTYQWWISDVEMDGYEIHPAFVQRGQTEVDYIYVGAYEADLNPVIAGHELHSRSGKQPMTGEVIYEVDFDAGENEPSAGDEVTTPGGDTWKVVGSEVSGGSWAGNDAAGKLWIRKIGDDDPGWSNDEAITNSTESNTVGDVDGAPSAIAFDIDDAEDFGNNIGSGWGITNIWTYSAIKMLMMADWGNLDSQTELGRGVVDKASGTGFNGELTGADSIDSNLDSTLTGAGTGTDGEVPVTWRGIENFWGNAWQFIIGYNAVDAEYRILNKAGLSGATLAGTIGGGDYTASAAVPITSDGYIDDIEWEDILKYLLIPSSVGGSSSTYIHDYFWAHGAGETNILLASAAWNGSSSAGAGYLNSKYVASTSDRGLGARLEYIPQ